MKKKKTKIIAIVTSITLIILFFGLYIYFTEFRAGRINRNPVSIKGVFECAAFPHNSTSQKQIKYFKISFLGSMARIKPIHPNEGQDEWLSYTIDNIQDIDYSGISSTRKFNIIFHNSKFFTKTLNVEASVDAETIPKLKNFDDYVLLRILNLNDQFSIVNCRGKQGGRILKP